MKAAATVAAATAAKLLVRAGVNALGFSGVNEPPGFS